MLPDQWGQGAQIPGREFPDHCDCASTCCNMRVLMGSGHESALYVPLVRTNGQHRLCRFNSSHSAIRERFWSAVF